MKGKKVTYTLRVDDDALREKKKALTNTIRGLFQSTIGGGGDAGTPWLAWDVCFFFHC